LPALTELLCNLDRERRGAATYFQENLRPEDKTPAVATLTRWLCDRDWGRAEGERAGLATLNTSVRRGGARPVFAPQTWPPAFSAAGMYRKEVVP